MAYKPILFNTEMVRAILYGRKTQTRRLIKDFAGEEITSILKPDGSLGKYGTKGWRGMLPDRGDGNEYCIEVRPPCEPGDILWVRETHFKDAGRYMYFANYAKDEKFYRNGQEVKIRWVPSIHMPKEAARIFLRVKDVRVKRLQDIKNYECVDEGAVKKPNITKRGDLVLHNRYKEEFARLWDTTIKPADRERYGWEANPWVWVIEFERIEKPEGW